jgi:hypothetical protein
VQVGRSKNLTPHGDPLIGMDARHVTVALEECFMCLKISCFWVMAVLEQVFRETLRFINHEGNESRFLKTM